MSQLRNLVPRTLVVPSESDAAASSIPSRQERSLRVLAVIPGGGQGMSFIFARRQVESLKKAGVMVEVFYLKSRALFTERSRLRKIIESYSPDIVHVHYGTITSFLCVCSTQRPIAITFRGSDLNPDPGIGFLRTRFGLALSQISALRASTILCTSDQLRKRLWWRKGQAVTLPSGVDLELFQPGEMQESRRVLGWEPGGRVVLFNKSKSPQLKGLSLAREAVGVAERKLGPVRLFELDGEVAPERIPIYLNAADCLVLASESEGSPNILKEAMACNLPVASVDVGDAAQRLDGVYPSQVVPRNATRLGQAIIDILETRTRSNGREKVIDCSEEKIAETLKKLYKSIAGRQKRTY